MKSYVLISILACLCLLITVKGTAQPGNYIPNEIIIKFKHDADENVQSELRTKIKAEQKTRKTSISTDKLQTWKIPQNTLFLKGQLYRLPQSTTLRSLCRTKLHYQHTQHPKRPATRPTLGDSKQRTNRRTRRRRHPRHTSMGYSAQCQCYAHRHTRYRD